MNIVSKTGIRLSPESHHAVTLISDFSLQNCKKISFCHLSHLVYSILLWQFKLRQMERIRYFEKSHFHRNRVFPNAMDSYFISFIIIFVEVHLTLVGQSQGLPPLKQNKTAYNLRNKRVNKSLLSR